MTSMRVNHEFYVAAVLVAPVMEELVFRGIPWVLGTTTGVILGSILWTLLHLRSAPVVLVSVPLYLKLWLGGFWIEAILVHAVHNALFLGILWISQDDTEFY